LNQYLHVSTPGVRPVCLPCAWSYTSLPPYQRTNAIAPWTKTPSTPWNPPTQDRLKKKHYLNIQLNFLSSIFLNFWLSVLLGIVLSVLLGTVLSVLWGIVLSVLLGIVLSVLLDIVLSVLFQFRASGIFKHLLLVCNICFLQHTHDPQVIAAK
jgi:hypothetical protein